MVSFLMLAVNGWIVTNWLIHENSETERQGERGFLQQPLISLESGSRLSHREA